MRRGLWVLLSLAVAGGVWLAPSWSVPLRAQSKPAAAAPEPKIKVGDMAPDFTLLDQNAKPVALHDFRGKKNVALAFYIFAFTDG